MQTPADKLPTMQRPQRWDEPFDAAMSDAVANQMLQLEPFRSMDQAKFRKALPLAGILKNDCRVLNLLKGDVIVREGDYGNSAFLIVSGDVIVSLKSLPSELLGRSSTPQRNWTRAIARMFGQTKHPEVRDYNDSAVATPEELGTRTEEGQTRVFLHDIPRVIPAGQSEVMQTGEIFGELSALTRTPRSATVVANSDVQLLEIRWQGFRDLMNADAGLKSYVEQQYRQFSLKTHLRETPLLQNIDLPVIQQIADATDFETYGSFQWNQQFAQTRKEDISARILSEPLIATEGDPVDGLILIRNGFARLSRLHGDGHQTIAYLGKGQSFGIRELVHNWRTGQQRPWMLSLRAVGYVDILRIPTDVVQELILPTIPKKRLPPPLPEIQPDGSTTGQRRMSQREETLDPGLLEFLVEGRYINGTQAMMIDLDRCTRCDDCVRACASTHDNNPRFKRTGQQYDNYMIANSCMHCLDPVCMVGCPTGAISRDAESGSITINDPTCIGCSTCANSCPYNNIEMVTINNQRGLPIIDQANGNPIQKATKCDLCADLGNQPACQAACPHDALLRIDLSSPADLLQLTKR